MKRKLFLLFALMIALTAFFAGCGNDDPAALTEGSMTVVVAGGTDEVFEVDFAQAEFTTENTVLDVLNFLKAEQGLVFDAEGEPPMVWLNSIGSLNPGPSEYVTVFTSVEADFDVSIYATEHTYGGLTLKSAGWGIAELSIGNDVTILFAIAEF